MKDDTTSDTLLGVLRAQDRDRYLTALFAPPERRNHLVALYLLHVELAKVPARVNEPMAGLIRLQWWRDAIDDPRAEGSRNLALLSPLAEALERSWLRRGDLIAMIDVREQEIDGEGWRDIDKVIAHARATGGAVQCLAARLLGLENENLLQAASDIGTAMTIASVIESLQETDAEAMQASSQQLANHAMSLLGGVSPPRHAIAAFLPALMARRDIKGCQSGDFERRRPPWLPLQLALSHLVGRV